MVQPDKRIAPLMFIIYNKKERYDFAVDILLCNFAKKFNTIFSKMADILEMITPASDDAVEDIIKQIRSFINKEFLKPGDRLPAERKLAEKFQVSRSTIRTAFKRLEFYKIIKTMPQSGSIITGIETHAFGSLINDILKIDNCDFSSLVETRAILEINAARFAALRRTEHDLEKIEKAMNAYVEKIHSHGSALEEDFQFHLTIAEASKNSVLKSMMQTITPDIMVNYSKFNVCKSNFDIPISEHRLLFEHIKNNDIEAAANIMSQHLTGVLTFAKNQQIII